MPNSNQHTKDEKYQVYLSERKALVDAALEQSRFFDKAILTLAAGVFGLSITFIRQFVPAGQNAQGVWLLFIAWILFGTSIVSTLISFLTSQSACEKQIAVMEKEYFHQSISSKTEKNKCRIWTARLNILSIVLFLFGIVFLGLFSATNL